MWLPNAAFDFIRCLDNMLHFLVVKEYTFSQKTRARACQLELLGRVRDLGENSSRTSFPAKPSCGELLTSLFVEFAYGRAWTTEAAGHSLTFPAAECISSVAVDAGVPC
jgi:hypothetical protein